MSMFWKAWEILDEGRQHLDRGPSPILLSEILAYVQLHGITDEADVEDMVVYIRMLDRQYLQHAYNKIAAARERERRKAESGQNRRSL